MNEYEKTRQSVIDIFTEEMLMGFWTHEQCPPGKSIIDCPVNEEGRHEPCMPCWKEFISTLAAQILRIPGIVILADDQSVPDNPYRLARKYNLSYACKLVQQDMLQARFLKVVKKEG